MGGMNSDNVETPISTIGWSVAEIELFAHLAGHAKREGAILDEYAKAATATQSKALAYLVEILMFQGLGVVKGSSMTDSNFWAVAGPVIALAGLVLAARGARRRSSTGTP